MGLAALRFLRRLWLVPALALALEPAAAAPPAAKPAAVQDYEPRPAIWLLADEDTKIYLFGTTHLLPPGCKWRSPAFDAVAKEADALAVETYIPPEEEDDPSFLRAVMLETPVPILKRVPKKDRAALKAAVAASGLAANDLAHVKTWMAAVFLGIAQQLDGWGVEEPGDAPGVEDVIEAEFRAAGKAILSVEEPTAGLDAFDAMSEREQVTLLLEAIAAPAADAELDPAAEDRAWATGRFEERWDTFMKDFPPVLYDGLVTKRNAAWTVWLEERLKKPGTLLFAVGAAHLAGPDSVQKMLAARGLEARRFD